VTMYPSSPIFYAGMGRALTGLGLHEEGLEYLDEAIELGDTSPYTYLEKGDILYNMKRYDEAISAYEAIPALNERMSDPYERIGQIYVKKGEYETAITYFDKAIQTANNFDYDDDYALQGKAFAESKLNEESGIGGCLIATATYGSELAIPVQQLREIRDNSLLQTESGSAFMNSFNQFYYSFSPTIADWERQSPVFKGMVKLAITPLVSSLSILNYIDMDSEESVLGYGISLILLNVGMYFVAPALVIVRVKKLFEDLI